MATVSLILSICAFLLSILAFIGASIAAIIVIGWSKSTHKVVQIPADYGETQTVYDLPREVMDKMPSSPETPTPEEYVRRAQRAEADLEAQYEQW